MEASTGIEPVYTDLQSAASPLRQLAPCVVWPLMKRTVGEAIGLGMPCFGAPYCGFLMGCPERFQRLFGLLKRAFNFPMTNCQMLGYMKTVIMTYLIELEYSYTLFDLAHLAFIAKTLNGKSKADFASNH